MFVCLLVNSVGLHDCTLLIQSLHFTRLNHLSCILLY